MLVHLRARVVVWLCIPPHFYTRNTATQLCACKTIFSDEITFICLHIFPSMHRTYMYIDVRADTPLCRSKPAWQPKLHTEDRLFTKSHKAPFSKRTVSLFLLFCRRVLHELLFKHKITGFSEKGFAYYSVLSITLFRTVLRSRKLNSCRTTTCLIWYSRRIFFCPHLFKLRKKIYCRGMEMNGTALSTQTTRLSVHFLSNFLIASRGE